MLSRIFAIVLILSILYIGSVFLLPDIADTYGHKSWNDSLRSLKSRIDTDNADFSSGWAIIDRVTDIAKPYIDESKAVTKQIQETVTTKTEQVKQAADSVEKAYKAVEWAKTDMQKLTTFGSGSR
jgi:hypothetical protein